MAGRTQQPTIAHILPWKAIGGTELATLRMARVTREAGFRNVFFVLRDCDEVAELFRAENFEVCEFTEIEPSIRHFVNYKAESSKLARQFREVKADLIHCADLRGSFYATLAAFLSRIPIVSHVRGQQPEVGGIDVRDAFVVGQGEPAAQRFAEQHMAHGMGEPADKARVLIELRGHDTRQQQ